MRSRIRPLSVLGALSLIVLLPTTSAAQAGSITGQVAAADGGAPVMNTFVEAVDGSGRTVANTISNASGIYRISGLAPGNYVVVANALGYRTQRAPEVSVTAGATATVDFSLEIAAFELNPIVVSASKVVEKATNAPANTSVVSEREIRERPAVTPVDHLRNTPGVDVVTSGVQSNNVVVRGFNNIFSGALHTLTDYRIASVPSLRVNFMHFVPQLDEDISRMEVVLGPGSALYGPNTANGVLHILTKSPLDEQGTTLSVAGGERDLLHGTFRTAHQLSDRFGFKFSGQLLNATEWRFTDPDEEDTRAVLGTPAEAALFPPGMSADERARRSARIANRDFDIQRWSGDLRADWRATDDFTAIFSAGLTNDNSIELTGIGAGQAVDWKYSYVQARATYRNWFAQTYVNMSDAGDTFLLRNGAPITDKSRVWVGQLQHQFNVGRRQSFTYGGDIVRTTPVTEGTINGRNEDNDNYTEAGAYIQSHSALHRMFDLVLAGRIDNHSELEDPVFSPRAALVFKPAESHTFRATYNRAFSTPTSLNLFLDIDAGPLGPLGPFGFRAHAQAPGRRGINLHAPDGSVQIRTPFASTNPADASVLRPVSPGDIYNYQIEAIARASAARGTPIPDLVQAVMRTFVADPAFASIPLIVLDPLTNSAAPFSPTAVRDVSGIEESTTSTFELGYKGLLADRLLLAADVWWSKHKNFTSPLIAATPLVLLAPQQLEEFMVPRLTQVFIGAGLPAEQAQAQAQAIASGMVQLPGGVVSSNDVSPSGPDLIVTYRNFGEVDLSGFDVAATAILTDEIQLGVTGSLVSDDFFNLPIGDRDSTVVALNAPRKKASANLTYRNLRSGINGQLRVRYTDEFPANSAGFVGLNCVDPSLQGECVQAYTLVDVVAGYRLPISGASVQLSVSNLFDKDYQSFVGVPTIGRMALLRVRYEFGGLRSSM